MKRRKFVTQSIAAGTAALIAPNVAAAEITEWRPSAVPSAPTRAMTRAWFEALVNSHVQIDGATSGPVAARIIAVRSPTARKPHWKAAATDQFSVILGVPADATVEGLCSVTHPRVGKFQLFLDPVGRAGAVAVSQAHFSLLV